MKVSRKWSFKMPAIDFKNTYRLIFNMVMTAFRSRGWQSQFSMIFLESSRFSYGYIEVYNCRLGWLISLKKAKVDFGRVIENCSAYNFFYLKYGSIQKYQVHG